MSRGPNKFPLDERLKALALSVAKHESGHYIAGRVLGFRMTEITIHLFHTPMRLGIGHRGEAAITLHEETATLDVALQFLERRIQVLFAGVLAEAMNVHTGEVDVVAAIKFLNDSAKSDFDKAREAMQLVRNIRHGRADSDAQVQSQLQAINDELWNKAGDIVMAERELIKGLSTRLAQMVLEVGPRYTLSESELNGMKPLQDRFAGQRAA